MMISCPATVEQRKDESLTKLAYVFNEGFKWEEVIFSGVQICLSMVGGTDLTMTRVCENDDFLPVRSGLSKLSQLYSEKILELLEARAFMNTNLMATDTT